MVTLRTIVVECMRLRFSFNSDRDASLSYSLFILSAVNIVELYPNWGKKKGALADPTSRNQNVFLFNLLK